MQAPKPSYDVATRCLHWLMAVLLIAQFAAVLAELVVGRDNLVMTVLIFAFIRTAWTAQDGVEFMASRGELDWALTVGKLTHTPLAWALGIAIVGYIAIAVYHQSVA